MKQVTSGVRRGFTTIELMIALVILAVVLSLAFPNFQARCARAAAPRPSRR
ncbi:MAG: prepilin-type N-terminal cleavage/methylation domain-containing protein [Rubrivivax sp.]